MASVYILHSKKLDRFYTGSCKDLGYRIDQHINRDYTRSFTAKANDWELFAYWDNLKYEQARAVEDHIKRMRNTTYMENLKQYPEIMQKLISRYR